MFSELFGRLFKNYAIASVRPRYIADLITQKHMTKNGLVYYAEVCPFNFINCSTTNFYLDGHRIQCMHDIEHLKSIRNPRLSIVKLPFNIMIFKVESYIPIHQYGV